MRRSAAYLDYNATAPIEPAAVDAMVEVAREWANPSSVHTAGRRARGLVETARDSIGRSLGCRADAIVFTGGGTEALGLALGGTQCASRLISATEHDAVHSQAAGALVIPVDGNGLVNLAALAAMLVTAPAPALVAVMHVNNETGVIQPIADIARIVRAAGGKLLVDAVQSAGKLPLPDGDFLAVSAHKFGGPPGVGALIVRCAEGFVAVQRGGGQERGLRGGTENLPGIAGFAAALEVRADHAWLGRVTALRDGLEARLGAGIIGSNAPRIGTTTSIHMPGVAASTQLMALDLAGFAVSSGAACSSGKVRDSHVLTAMGISSAVAGATIRVSLGWNTSEAEVREFGDAWLALAARLGRKAA